MTKLASYPLRDEPGARWRYGYHSDVIGRLIEIGSGLRSDDYLQKVVFEPLKMVDTGFFAPPSKAALLVRAYDAKGADITTKLPPSSDYLGRKPFQSNGGGLVTTAGDWIRFSRMLLNGGSLDGARVLKGTTVAEMCRNQITRGRARCSGTRAPMPASPASRTASMAMAGATRSAYGCQRVRTACPARPAS